MVGTTLRTQGSSHGPFYAGHNDCPSWFFDPMPYYPGNQNKLTKLRSNFSVSVQYSWG